MSHNDMGREVPCLGLPSMSHSHFSEGDPYMLFFLVGHLLDAATCGDNCSLPEIREAALAVSADHWVGCHLQRDSLCKRMSSNKQGEFLF